MKERFSNEIPKVGEPSATFENSPELGMAGLRKLVRRFNAAVETNDPLKDKPLELAQKLIAADYPKIAATRGRMLPSYAKLLLHEVEERTKRTSSKEDT